jgi:hypothetical protein
MRVIRDTATPLLDVESGVITDSRNVRRIDGNHKLIIVAVFNERG